MKLLFALGRIAGRKLAALGAKPGELLCRLGHHDEHPTPTHLFRRGASRLCGRCDQVKHFVSQTWIPLNTLPTVRERQHSHERTHPYARTSRGLRRDPITGRRADF